MKKQILIFGALGGMISWIWFIVMGVSGKSCMTMPYAEVFGYATLLLSMVFVFFGVRSYRDNVKGGHITFAKAFGTGMLIALTASLVYTIGWTIIQNAMIPDFTDNFYAMTMEKMKAEGATANELAQQQKFFEFYKTPFGNFLLTFLIEPLPIGILVSLISAIILRKKNKNVSSEITA